MNVQQKNKIRSQLRQLRDTSQVNMLDFKAVLKAVIDAKLWECAMWMNDIDTMRAAMRDTHYKAMMDTLDKSDASEDAKPAWKALHEWIARDYRTPDSVIAVKVWALYRKDGSYRWLGCLVDGHGHEIHGSVPWDEQTTYEALGEKMHEIYQAYKVKHAGQN